MYKSQYSSNYRQSKSSGKKWIIVLGIFFGVLAISLYVLFSKVLPTAEIVIIPQTTEGSFEETILLDASISEMIGNPVTLPTRLVSIEASDTKELTATTEEDTGERASGIVKLINKTGKPVEVLPGDALKARNGREYTTKRGVTIEETRVAENGDIIFGETLVEVIALKGGDAANLNSGILTITALDPSEQSKVYGEIQSGGISGGTSNLQIVVGEDDLKRGTENLSERVEQLLFNKFREHLTPDEILPEELIKREELVASDPEVGKPADTFLLTITQKATGLAIYRDNLSTHLTNIINETLGEESDRILINGDNYDSYEYIIEEIDLEKGTATIKIKGNYKTRNFIDTDELQKQIAGKSESEARRAILAQDNIKDARIIIRKSFKSDLPKNLDKLVIQIQE